MKTQQYSILKTLKKVGVILVEVLIAGGLVYVSEEPKLIFLVPLFEGIRNYWKHKN